jgi:hypothetical protein
MHPVISRPFNASSYCIRLRLDRGRNTLQCFTVPLRLLMQTRRNAFSRGLRPSPSKPFPQPYYNYHFDSEQRNPHILLKKRRHVDALSLTQACGSVHRPSAWGIVRTVALRGPFRSTRVSSASNNCPSTECASAVNVVCRDVHVLGPKPMSFKHNFEPICCYDNYSQCSFSKSLVLTL